MEGPYTEPTGQHDILEHIIGLGLPVQNILDIGLGSGTAAQRFLRAGWSVTATGFHVEEYVQDTASSLEGIDVIVDVDVCNMDTFPDYTFDAVWCSHVLEHVGNVDQALQEIQRVLRPGGRLLLCVPPFKHEIVGGHVETGWNVGQLMYRLALLGFDTADGSFVRHGYNVAAIVRRGDPRARPRDVRMARGDLERLSQQGYFPPEFELAQGCNGDVAEVNWNWTVPPRFPRYRGPQNIEVRRRLPETLRIGMLIPWLTTGRGGTERVGALVANSLAERGHEVFVHTWDDKCRRPSWPLHEHVVLRHHAEDDTPVSELQTLMELSAQQLHVLVGMHTNREFFRHVYLAHRTGVPILLSEHINPIFPQKLGRFGQRERTAIFSAADTIHLLLHEFRETLPRYLRSRIRVIPNSVPPAEARADPIGIHGRRMLLTVTRMTPLKNVDILIRAFHRISARFPGWTLAVVGYGKEKARLEKLASGLGLDDSVQFFGRLEDTYAMYQRAQVFCLPSKTEAFPLTVLEALTHGLPVVGFADCPGVNNIVRDGVEGRLAASHDRERSLAEALTHLMDDAELRERLGTAALRRYDDYSLQRMIDAWEDMVRATAAIPPERSRAALQVPPKTQVRAELALRLRGHVADYMASPIDY